jgi:hypothetical protein
LRRKKILSENLLKSYFPDFGKNANIDIFGYMCRNFISNDFSAKFFFSAEQIFSSIVSDKNLKKIL